MFTHVFTRVFAISQDPKRQDAATDRAVSGATGTATENTYPCVCCCCAYLQLGRCGAWRDPLRHEPMGVLRVPSSLCMRGCGSCRCPDSRVCGRLATPRLATRALYQDKVTFCRAGSPRTPSLQSPSAIQGRSGRMHTGKCRQQGIMRAPRWTVQHTVGAGRFPHEDSAGRASCDIVLLTCTAAHIETTARTTSLPSLLKPF